MRVTAKKLEYIVNRIVANVHSERIYLFGSQARGTARSDSDIDLLIIANMEGSRRKRSLRIRRMFPHREFAIDIFVFKPEEFEHQKQFINSLSNIVAKEGKIVYDRERMDAAMV